MTFSDYMRNAIRLAALMQLPVVYQFTHDSILLGEDGPTHQPVEHLAALRVIPNLTVIRPADTNEVKGAWVCALESKQPVALILSRQGLPDLVGTAVESVRKGAYILEDASAEVIDVCFLATGSELALAIDVAKKLTARGLAIRVVSMPSFELFERQALSYKESVLPKSVRRYCSIEAQSSWGWHKYIGQDGIAISVDEFGLSAPQKDIAQHFGFTVDGVISKLGL